MAVLDPTAGLLNDDRRCEEGGGGNANVIPGFGRGGGVLEGVLDEDIIGTKERFVGDSAGLFIDIEGWSNDGLLCSLS